MADYAGEVSVAVVGEQYRPHSPLDGFYFGRSKLVAGPKIQVCPGGSAHFYAALDDGQSVSCWCDVPVDGKACLEVRGPHGDIIDEVFSSVSGDSEKLTVGPLVGISKGIYTVRVVNRTSGSRFADARAYFYDIEVASA